MSYAGQAIQAAPFFPRSATAVPDNELGGPAELETAGTVCDFSKGETIFNEGDLVDASYKVVRGVVRLCRLSSDGRRQIAGFRLPGDLIGIESNGEYDMTAEAVRDVVAVRYSKARLDRLSHEKPGVRDHLLSHLCRDLRSAQEHLITLGCQSAVERVASFLLQLARRAGVADGGVIDMQLGRQDIADYLGLTLETVSRTFTELTNRDLIATPKRRHVQIKNRARLKAAAIPLH